MQGLTHKETELTLKLNTEGMTPSQVRLIKTVHALLCNVLTTEEESEYFECSAELFQKAAEIVKHAQFAESKKDMNYGEQAVEYSLDNLSETIEGNGIQNRDN